MPIKFFLATVAVSVLFIAACEDMGDPVSSTGTAPSITSISPDSGKAGDTVRITGKNFTSAKGSVKFGSVNADTIVSWSDTLIRVKVPSGSVTGTVVVTAAGKSSTGKQFKIVGSVVLVSFSNSILPLFTGATYGCTGCHGGQNNLNLDSYNGVLSGNTGFSTAAASQNGPVINPGNASTSILVRKLRSNTLPFGARMPFGGSQVSDVDLQKITDWVNQGALNN